MVQFVFQSDECVKSYKHSKLYQSWENLLSVLPRLSIFFTNSLSEVVLHAEFNGVIYFSISSVWEKLHAYEMKILIEILPIIGPQKFYSTVIRVSRSTEIFSKRRKIYALIETRPDISCANADEMLPIANKFFN